MIKAICEKHEHMNIILNRERLKAFFLKSEEDKDPCSLQVLFNIESQP